MTTDNNSGQQPVKTKEEIVEEELSPEELAFFGDRLGNIYDAMEEYASQFREGQQSEYREQSEGEKMYYEGLTRRYGRTPEYQFTGDKCVPGCKNFSHYETKHHPDCPFYPGSLSEQYDKLVAPSKEQGEEELVKLIEGFGDFYHNYENIDPPKGINTIIREYLRSLPASQQREKSAEWKKLFYPQNEREQRRMELEKENGELREELNDVRVAYNSLNDNYRALTEKIVEISNNL